MLKLGFLLSLNLLWVGLAESQSQTCNTTEVNQYRYSCNLQGQIENPVPINNYFTVPSVLACAEKCLENIHCHSTAYDASNQECTTYELKLGNMNFTNMGNTPGIYNDRACYSNNCNEIAACQAIQTCQAVNIYHADYDWTEFGCGYGITSTFDSSSRQEILDGTLTACEAAHDCGKLYADKGPFEVHFYLPTQQWICLLKHAFSDEYGSLTLAENKVNYQTFTVKNSSVGASYAFYESYNYYYK